MAVEGWVLKAVQEELDSQLAETRIDRIFEHENGDFTFQMRKRGKNFRLFFSLHPESARVHFTQRRLKNPVEPPHFCRLLRSRLEGARVIGVSQPGVERMLEFTLVNLDDLSEIKTYYLIAELMGRHSNLILLNDERQIIDSAKHVFSWQNRYREVLPGRQYIYPPGQNKMQIEEYTLPEPNLAKDISLALHLRKNLDGVGPKSVEAFLQSLNLNEDFPLAALDDEEKKNILSSLQSAVKNKQKGQLFVDLQGNVLPFEFAGALGKWQEASLALDRFYEVLDELRSFNGKKISLIAGVKSALEKALKKRFALEEDLHSSQDAEHWRIWGELLKNTPEPEQRGEAIQVTNFYDPDLDLIEVPLDIRFNVQQNTQNYFKRYAKARKGEKLIVQQLALTNEDIGYLESVLNSLEQIIDQDSLKETEAELAQEGLLKRQIKEHNFKKPGKQNPGKKSKTLKDERVYPLQLVIEGVRVSVGRNNSQNDYLTMELASPKDWWFHVKDSAGSHVVVHQEELSDSLFEKAAALAAYYSRERENSYVAVDYTQRRNVKKFKSAKPGAVHYVNFYTLFVAPLSPEDLKD